MNNQEQKSIKERILEKIKRGEVKMRPRIFFILKAILIILGFFLFFGFSVFLLSFIHFHLRASGLWYLPRFGLRGFFVFFRFLPWILIFLSLILILILEILAKRFSFVWRRPILYSLLIIIFIVLIFGFFIEKTPFHSKLFFQARQGRLPLMTPIYREFGMPRFKDVHRGIVEELTEDGFLLRKADDELLTVILSSNTQFPFGKEVKEGDSVVVMGKKDDGTINAIGILKIDDQFRVFEQKLPRPPMRWKRYPF